MTKYLPHYCEVLQNIFLKTSGTNRARTTAREKRCSRPKTAAHGIHHGYLNDMKGYSEGNDSAEPSDRITTVRKGADEGRGKKCRTCSSRSRYSRRCRFMRPLVRSIRPSEVRRLQEEAANVSSDKLGGIRSNRDTASNVTMSLSQVVDGDSAVFAPLSD